MKAFAARAAFTGILMAILSALPDGAQAQRCGYFTNPSGHYGPRPCGNFKAYAPSVRCRDGSFGSGELACSAHGGAATASP